MALTTDLKTIKYSGDIRIDSLQDDMSLWNFIIPSRNTLNYTFDISANSYVKKENKAAIVEFNDTQKAAARAIMGYATSVTGINLVEVTSSAEADIHFAAKDITDGKTIAGLNASKNSYSSGADKVVTEINVESIVYLDNKEFLEINSAPVAGNQGYQILLHEIGHALGLGHPFNSPKTLPKAQDNTGNTVMSYTTAQPFKSTFQEYDLLALKWIYGGDGLAGDWGYNSPNGNTLTPPVPVVPVVPPVVDTIGPIVASISPNPNAIRVPVASNIVITFNEPIQKGVGSIELRLGNASGTVIERFDVASSVRLGWHDNQLTLDPSNNLIQGTTYTLVMADGVLQDQVGNAYNVSATDRNYYFTTFDPVLPTLVKISPTHGVGGVTPSQAVEITFSEPIKISTGQIEIHLGTSAAGPLVETVDLNSPNITLAGPTLRLSLGHAWEKATDYFVVLPVGGVQDMAGNPVPAIGTHFQTASHVRGQFYNTPSDNVFNGLAAIETAVYSAPRSDFTLARARQIGTDAWQINGQGHDVLHGIERLQFVDKRVALDVSPTMNAGKALLFWNVLYPEKSHDPAWMGQVINQFDAGQSMQGVFQWALNTWMPQSNPDSNKLLIERVYQNLLGTAPDATTTATLLALIQGHRPQYVPAKFLAEVAQLDINVQQIKLLGLQETGVEYL